MRPTERIDNFLRILGKEWKKQGSDLRFTQFLYNNGMTGLGGVEYYVEEDDILNKGFPDVEPREYLFWGTRGINGNEILKYTLIKDLDTDHIEAILANVKSIAPLHKETMEKELKSRKNGTFTKGI